MKLTFIYSNEKTFTVANVRNLYFNPHSRILGYEIDLPDIETNKENTIFKDNCISEHAVFNSYRSLKKHVKIPLDKVEIEELIVRLSEYELENDFDILNELVQMFNYVKIKQFDKVKNFVHPVFYSTDKKRYYPVQYICRHQKA